MSWFALIFTATLLAQEPATGDAIMLNQIMREPGMIRTSYIEKALQRAGDGIAVSIARTQPRTALLDIVKASILIDVLAAAFENPSVIAEKENRNPGVSLLLLETIARETPDAAVQQKARNLILNLDALTH